jgi:hypothetical protein
LLLQYLFLKILVEIGSREGTRPGRQRGGIAPSDARGGCAASIYPAGAAADSQARFGKLAVACNARPASQIYEACGRYGFGPRHPAALSLPQEIIFCLV